MPYDDKKYSWRRAGGRKARKLTEEEKGSKTLRRREHNRNQRAIYGGQVASKLSTTSYNSDLHPVDIVNWFRARYNELDDPVEVVTKQGELKYVQPPGQMPSFSGYAMEMHCSVRTLRDWCTRYPEFEDAWMQCEAIQEEAMVKLGANGSVPPTFAVLLMKNRANWTEKGEITAKGGVTIVFDDLDKDL